MLQMQRAGDLGATSRGPDLQRRQHPQPGQHQQQAQPPLQPRAPVLARSRSQESRAEGGLHARRLPRGMRPRAPDTAEHSQSPLRAPAHGEQSDSRLEYELWAVTPIPCRPLCFIRIIHNHVIHNENHHN
jgi:hypothetical protein